MSKSAIPSSLESDLKNTCVYYAETMRERGVPYYGTAVVSHMYDDPPYSPMKEYDIAFSNVKYHYRKPKYSVEIVILSLRYVLEITADSRFIDLQLLNLILGVIKKEPQTPVQEIIASDTALQTQIVNFLLKDVKLQADVPKLKRDESKSLLKDQRDKFMPMVEGLWPYVSVAKLHSVSKAPSLFNVFNQLSDDVRNFAKRKMLESKPKELAIYPLFTDSKEALIYIRYQEMNKGVKAIPNTERAKCLSYFETKINKNEIKHDADSIRYLTLLEACHKQTMHMVTDTKLKNPEKIKLITDFGARLDLFYKELNEKGAIEPDRLFNEIIKVRLSLKKMQEKNLHSLSTAEELFDKYFGDNFLRFYKMDYFDKQAANILNHVSQLEISKLTQEIGDEKEFSLDRALFTTEQTSRLEIKVSAELFKDYFGENEDDEELKLITSLPKIPNSEQETTTSDQESKFDLAKLEERFKNLKLGYFNSEEELLTHYSKSENLEKISNFLFEAKIDGQLTGRVYVKLSELDAKNHKDSDKLRRVDVLNLVAKLFGFKKGFHSKSTPTGINPDKLEVLGKLLKFEYSNDGYLTDQGIKQLANFIMLEIIKDSKSSFTLFKKSTHQIFTEHVGLRLNLRKL